MSELALQLIAENKKTKAKTLDLGNCGLMEVPEEALECVWIEELVLSDRWYEYDLKKRGWEQKMSQNLGEPNTIGMLPTDCSAWEPLRKLIIANIPIQNLVGIEGLVNLEILCIEKTEIIDLTPISSLFNLKELYCFHTKINKLSDLQKLNNLIKLDCSFTQVTDLLPLADLTNLKILDCNNSQISSLASLKKLISVEIIHCNTTQIYDLSLLENLTNLEELNCSSTQISDLTPLKNLREIKNLDCSNTQISDWSPIENLTNLEELDCSSTQISDLTPLKNLRKLENLNCSNTQISDLTPLKNLRKLENLNCSNTQISDLTPLKNLRKLISFNCFSTQILDWSLLENFINLERLNCSSTQISDLTPLKNLKNLKNLYCSNTKIFDWSLLENFVNLEVLNCSSTQISDLTPLKNLKNLKNLYCSNTQISDWSLLENFVNLEKLWCWSTQISDLTPLKNLRKLENLDCSSTKISDWSLLENFVNLEEFDCSYTQISDLTPLKNLKKLKNLSCSGTQISDWSLLENFVNLEVLNCSSTQISDLTPLKNLRKLENLDCSSTKISDWSLLENFVNLEELNCSSTQISDLTPLKSLRKLENLDCSNTKISDWSLLENFVSLEEFDCSWTQISDLTPLKSLRKLIRIVCLSTRISDLTPLNQFAIKNIIIKWGGNDYSDQPSLFIKDCPLIIPPIEFAMEGNEAVLEYFDQLDETPKLLNEVKIIFLGEGAAGKTSLIKCLLGEPFDDKESQTHGIRIRKMPFQIQEDEIMANVWDFGGQEVMHATHQFFLSERCIYVLVLNSRSEDRAEYWLKHAASFGGKSPVLVVLNKIDENPSFEVNRKVLLEKYPQIRDFYRISCQSQKGVEAFQQALQEEVTASPARRTPFPENWGKVKAHFSNMKADYIQSAEYKRVCVESGVGRAFSQQVLLQFLHDLGIVINFRNLKNFDTQILNPLWLTNGVYRIINSELLEGKKGMLEEDDFGAIINDPRYTKADKYTYPTDKLHYIVRIMQEFELCYPIDGQRYVVPQLLSVSEPDFKMEGPVLRFVLRFPDFLPDSIFPRFMVKSNNFIKGELRWRTGVVLHKPEVFDALALVRADKEDKLIEISVCGEERRRFLSFIRATFREIVDTFANLQCEEMAPVPEATELLEYEYLVEAEKAGEKEVFIRELKKRVSISDLLNGVEEPTMRDELEQVPVKVFISYSHADSDYLKELSTALSPLVRLNALRLWSDRSIDAGEEWEREIFRELDEADIVLCLVSSDFIASDFCWKKEFERALAAHQTGKKVIVPVRLRDCDWKDLPIAKFQGPPAQWIASAIDRDPLWREVSERLRPLLSKIKADKVARMKSSSLR